MKKLRSKKAETLVETLVARLIIALSAVMIMTASVTAARINQKVRQTDISCTMSTADQQPAGTGSVTYGGRESQAAIKMYTDNGYYFYYKG